MLFGCDSAQVAKVKAKRRALLLNNMATDTTSGAPLYVHGLLNTYLFFSDVVLRSCLTRALTLWVFGYIGLSTSALVQSLYAEKLRMRKSTRANPNT